MQWKNPAASGQSHFADAMLLPFILPPQPKKRSQLDGSRSLQKEDISSPPENSRARNRDSLAYRHQSAASSESGSGLTLD
jgi:hypothetical protein